VIAANDDDSAPVVVAIHSEKCSFPKLVTGSNKSA
jgi:hypothetical protein